MKLMIVPYLVLHSLDKVTLYDRNGMIPYRISSSLLGNFLSRHADNVRHHIIIHKDVFGLGVEVVYELDRHYKCRLK